MRVSCLGNGKIDDESGWEDGKVKTQLSKLLERIYT